MAEPLPIVSRSSKSPVEGILHPPEPDPLADVDYTGDIETDALAELDALDAAFRDRRRREDRRFKQATDSEFWIALCFPSREDKERFLRKHGLIDLGDKYLDGRAVDARLER